MFVATSVQAGNFNSKTRSSTDSSGTVTTTTYSKGDGGTSVTKTKKYKNGATSTTTVTNGKKTQDGRNGVDHAETGARDVGGSKDQASKAAEKHKFCQENPDHADCKNSGGSSEGGNGNSLYEPNEESRGDNPFILK